MDGNGRTARLLLNLELMKSGFPAIVLPVERRLAYYEALDHANVEGDLAPFVALVAESVREGFGPYWHVLGVNPALELEQLKMRNSNFLLNESHLEPSEVERRFARDDSDLLPFLLYRFHGAILNTVMSVRFSFHHCVLEIAMPSLAPFRARP